MALDRRLKPAPPPKSDRRGVAWGFNPTESCRRTQSGLLAPEYSSPRMPWARQEIRTYFTTFSTAGRRRLFQVEAKAELMAETLRDYRKQGRFSLHAFVIMPDHVHALITPAPEVSLEKAIQLMKG